jgi:hypothetical protein
MPEPSFTERLKAAAQRLADKVNNSSVNKTVEKYITPNKNASTPSIKLYQDVADKTSQKLEGVKPVTNDPETVHRAIVAVQGKTLPVVRPAFTSTPFQAVYKPLRASTDSAGITTPQPNHQTAQEAVAADQQRLIDALKYQQELARIQELRARLTTGN